jgi:carbamoyltransferase
MKILGISCFYHDSAAVLIDDGKIIAAAEEERFSRVKHDSGFPSHAAEFCLSKGNIKATDLNWVVFYEKPFVKFERINLSVLATAPFARQQFVNGYKTLLKDKLWIKSIIAKKIKIESKKILFTGHHLSHSAAAFYTSGFDSSAILTCDGVGEWTTTAWGIARNNKIELKKEIKFPHSLGLFYSAFTQFLGFQVNEGEFKVMGLAPYGKPVFVNSIKKMILQSTDGSFNLDMSYFNFHLSDKSV